MNLQSSATLSSGDYWLLVRYKGVAAANGGMRYDSGDTDQGTSKIETYEAFPDSITLTNNDNKYSIYATYSTGGGDEPVDDSGRQDVIWFD